MGRSRQLLAYFEHEFLRAKKLSPRNANCYRYAIAALVELYGRKACRVDLLTADQIDAFRKQRLQAGFSRSFVDGQYVRLRHVLRHARPQDFPHASGRYKRRLSDVVAPVDEPGTVWHFFVAHYRPERFDCTAGSMAQTEYALRSLFRLAGGGVLLAQLCDKLLADWAADLITRKRRPATVRGQVGRVESLWRDAHRKGLVAMGPNGRRRKRPRTLPEAWFADEFEQLIAGTHHPGLQAKLPTGVAAGVFLRALLLTAYDTGFRRGDLFGLRKADLRADGVVTIIQSKTGQPLTRAVRPETMAGLREADVPGELLLPWPQWDTTFSALYRDLLRCAGLPVQRRNQLQKIRRTTASYAERDEAGAAAKLLGHSDPSMAPKHYIDPRIAAKMPKLPPNILKGGAA